MASAAYEFGDTDPKTAEFYIQLHRSMTQGERLTRTLELCDFQRGLQIAGVRAMYPEAGERALQWRLAERLLGRELTTRIYGAEPVEES